MEFGRVDPVRLRSRASTEQDESIYLWPPHMIWDTGLSFDGFALHQIKDQVYSACLALASSLASPA